MTNREAKRWVTPPEPTTVAQSVAAPAIADSHWLTAAPTPRRATIDSTAPTDPATAALGATA